MTSTRKHEQTHAARSFMHELTALCYKCRREIKERFDLSVPGKLICSSCGYEIVSITPLRGVVYVLSNPSMPGLVKIGHTTRDIESRVAELSSGTSVPERFRIEATFASPNPSGDEAKVHELLKAAKRSQGREFFELGVDRAIEIVRKVIGRDPCWPRLVPDYVSKKDEGAYSFACKSCGNRFGSRYPRNSSICCPFCFSRDFK